MVEEDPYYSNKFVIVYKESQLQNIENINEEIDKKEEYFSEIENKQDSDSQEENNKFIFGKANECLVWRGINRNPYETLVDSGIEELYSHTLDDIWDLERLTQFEEELFNLWKKLLINDTNYSCESTLEGFISKKEGNEEI